MTTRSWVAVYRATGDTCLLGGVRQSRSSRWQTKQDAETYLQSALEINRGAGRPCDGHVEPSDGTPEIFVHCGTHATSIACRCPGCGKVLTRQDALDSVKADTAE